MADDCDEHILTKNRMSDIRSNVAAFTRTQFPIETVSWPRNRIVKRHFASQPISRQTVFKSMRFPRWHHQWNRGVLKTLHFWKRFQNDPGLITNSNRRRVNERYNRIETDAVTNEPRPHKQCLSLLWNVCTQGEGGFISRVFFLLAPLFIHLVISLFVYLFILIFNQFFL